MSSNYERRFCKFSGERVRYIDDLPHTGRISEVCVIQWLREEWKGASDDEKAAIVESANNIKALQEMVRR